jgi:threonine synthase
MSLVTQLKCISCGQAYRADQVSYTCPSCGPDLGILDVEYDMAAARRGLTWARLAERPLTHWRYRELLPVDEPPAWPVGWTPIWPAPRLAAELGLERLRLKDEGRNPTASFKDRASSVGVVRALACGAKTIACASTGNAASSLAGYAAVAGIPAVIFVPKAAPQPKIAQLLVYGATVFRVQGTYAQAYDLCMQSCAEFGWYNRCCAINPYLVEGKKTAGLEIAEQCRDDAPDWVAVSVGDGCTIAGIGKGLRQMRELGLIDWRTRLLAVQAAGAAPIARAWDNEAHRRDAGATPGAPVTSWPGTLADSIDVPVPRNPAKALAAVRESDGSFVEVSDEEILTAMRLTGRLAGVFAEPAASAAVAGVATAVRKGIIKRSQSVLAVITGSGLKDIRAATQAVGDPIDVPPELAAIRSHVGK